MLRDKVDTVDWVDVERHALGAVAGMLVLAMLGVAPFVAAIIVTVIGVVREGIQQWAKGKPVSPLAWSFHKWMEAAAWPIVAFPMAIYGVGVC